MLDSMTATPIIDGMPVTYYSINDIAERLGISRQRVHKLIKDRDIPHIKEGRSILVSETDLHLFEDRKDGRPRKTVGRPRKIK